MQKKELYPKKIDTLYPYEPKPGFERISSDLIKNGR